VTRGLHVSISHKSTGITLAYRDRFVVSHRKDDRAGIRGSFGGQLPGRARSPSSTPAPHRTARPVFPSGQHRDFHNHRRLDAIGVAAADAHARRCGIGINCESDEMPDCWLVMTAHFVGHNSHLTMLLRTVVIANRPIARNGDATWKLVLGLPASLGLRPLLFLDVLIVPPNTTSLGLSRIQLVRLPSGRCPPYANSDNEAVYGELSFSEPREITIKEIVTCLSLSDGLISIIKALLCPILQVPQYR